MQVQRTVTLILDDDVDLLETLRVFQSIQQRISPVCYGDGISKPLNALALHKACYQDVIGTINAQMTCTAIRLVAGAYVSVRKGYVRRLALEQKRKSRHERKGWKYFPKVVKEPGLCEFNKPAALFLIGAKGRDASFCKRDGKLSIWTVAGRKHIGYKVVGAYQHYLDAAVDIDSINVIERNGKLVGRLAVTIDVPESKGILPVGVDLNETNAVVAANADDESLFISGQQVKVLNKRSFKTRKRVQKKLAARKAQNKDTRSLRRLLQRTGRKKSNRTRTFAQTAAKRLCQWATPNSILVFEALAMPQPQKGVVGVKKNIEKSKALRRRLSAWQYGLIRQCVANKAQEYGLSVCEVNPMFTSQDCSHCGLRGKRKRHKFVCPHCSFECHADVNAARNIRDKFIALRRDGTLSIAPETLSPLAEDEGKPTALAVGR